MRLNYLNRTLKRPIVASRNYLKTNRWAQSLRKLQHHNINSILYNIYVCLVVYIIIILNSSASLAHAIHNTQIGPSGDDCYASRTVSQCSSISIDRQIIINIICTYMAQLKIKYYSELLFFFLFYDFCKLLYRIYISVLQINVKLYSIRISELSWRTVLQYKTSTSNLDSYRS